MNVESLLPEFFDIDALRVPPQKTYRIDNGGERLYARLIGDEVKAVPSVTTVLRMLPTDQHLIKWYADLGYDEARAHIRRRANYGTYMHILFKELLLGGEIVFTNSLIVSGFETFLNEIGERADGYDLRQIAVDLKSDVFAFCQWVQDYKVKPLAIEYIVFGEKYAGAADLICKLSIKKTSKIETYENERMFAFLPPEINRTDEKEVIALIDFKSGRKGFHDDNKLQLYALRELWNAERPETPIEMIANLGMKNYKLPLRCTPYDFKEHTDSSNKRLFAKWPLLVDLYHTEGIEIKKRIEFAENVAVSIKTPIPAMLSEINPLEHIGGDI